MAAPSWISGILGLTTLLTGNGQTTQRRQTLKVTGLSVFDDGTQTVLGGVQTLSASGAWDGKSALLQVKGSGARAITLPNPDATVLHEGFQLLITDFNANAAAGNISITGSATVTINTNNGFSRLVYRANNNWQAVN